MRTVYGPGRSDVWYHKVIRISSAVALFIWIVFVLSSGGDSPYPFFCVSILLGSTMGFILVILIVKRWREAREDEKNVVVEDRGVIAHGNYLLWDEIKELREDPWEGYQLVFRPLNKREEPLRFVTIDGFPHFDHFIKQLREHGVEIKIRHW